MCSQMVPTSGPHVALLQGPAKMAVWLSWGLTSVALAQQPTWPVPPEPSWLTDAMSWTDCGVVHHAPHAVKSSLNQCPTLGVGTAWLWQAHDGRAWAALRTLK
jgi:hypothetical protein